MRFFPVRRRFCDTCAMCPSRKQILNAALPVFIAGLTFLGAAHAGEPGGNDRVGDQFGGSAGGVTVGEGYGGITDRAYVTAPPNFIYVVEKERGSFLDCGDGSETRSTDADGRDIALMQCGVTLTETIVIPAAAQSARIIIHY